MSMCVGDRLLSKIKGYGEPAKNKQAELEGKLRYMGKLIILSFQWPNDLVSQHRVPWFPELLAL